MQNGFSLVELSIVLVILGLLVGGILSGQNLIRVAELRSVITEFQHYQTAAYAFRDKYRAWPGDFRRAEDVWGTMATGTCPDATAGTGTQTCNGNGDGMIDPAGAAGQTGERFTFWQHLANAGLIEGTYTGLAGGGAGYDGDIGINIPEGRITNVGWDISYLGIRSGNANQFDGEYGNRLMVGRNTADSSPFEDFLLPEEAWGIDGKIDDGIPSRGTVAIEDRVDCTIRPDGSAVTNSAPDAANLDAEYNLGNRSTACAMHFRNFL